MPLRLLLAATAFVLAGCSGAQPSDSGHYDAARNETSYQSPATDIGAPAQGGMRGASKITLSAEATCQGEDCTPGEWTLSLSKSGGNNAVADYDQISFETAEGSVTFGNAVEALRSAKFFSSAQGEFVRISVPTRIFTSFAESPMLLIRLGGNIYSLPYERRGTLRRMLASAQSDADETR